MWKVDVYVKVWYTGGKKKKKEGINEVWNKFRIRKWKNSSRL